MNDNWLKTVGRIGPIAILAIASSKPAFAQITPDQTLGNENSVIVPINAQLEHIQGGALRGSNLFHSFQDFNIKEGHSAYFVNPAAIQTIFSRVTGVNPSHILGKLGVLGEANLYLINPNGIIFGENASLDIKGAFVASTASSFVFPDGSQYSAVNPEIPPVLINNVPIQISLQFEGEPATIVNAGHLQAGGNITLTGGMVVNTGKISAPENTVNLLAVQPETIVRMSDRADILEVIEPTVASELESNLEALEELSEETGLRVTETGDYEILGTGITVSPETGLTIASGEIEATGGTVRVLGNKVGLVDANIDVSGANGGGTVHIGGSDRGQNSLLNAEQTWVNEGTNITADALGEGDGGTAIVWADKATAFYGNISARGGNIAGDGGFVEVSGKENLLFEGMVDVGTSFGESGTLLLDPENIRIVSNFGLNDSQLPNIQFGDDPGTTYTISKTALAAIAAIPGNNIILQATNDIIIENIGDLTFIPGTNSVTFMADGDRDGSGDFVMNDLEATIITNGRDLTISGANITAGNLNTSALTPFFFGTANGRAGGSVTITATESISTGAIDTSSNTGNAGSGDTNGGAGGMVTITATESITTGAIDTSSNILLNSSLGDTNGGAGGMVQITATNGDIQTESIKTSSISNGSSDIDGAAAGNVYLMAINGKIQTEDIDTSSISNIANSFVSPAIPATATTQTAGTIELTANNQIETGDINTSSVATVFNGIANAGMGGKTELTTNGNIQTGKIETFSTASTFNGNANAEISGTVTLNTTRGNIQTENIQTFSVARVSSGLGNANAGTGGEIEVNATRGNLQLGAIDTSTASIGVLSGTSTAGNAGQIALTSNGNLIPNTINASSTHGNGGNIVLKSSGGTIQTTGGNLNTGSLGAKGGNITLDARDDITLANFINSSGAIAGGNVIITSQSGEINGTLFAINTGDIGQTNRDAAEASSLNLPVLIPRNSENINAGDISFSALRNIRLNRGIIDASGENVFQSSVQRGSGGSISFNSGEKILFDGVRISSQTEFGTGKNIEITGRSLSANQSFIALSTNDVAQQSGNIRITAPEFIELNQDSLIQLQTEEEAIGGNITIDRTNRLTIQNSLLITLATTDNSGGAEAGKLLVNTNLLEISGTSSDGSIPSGLASLSSRQGRSGEIAVNADRIILSDGGGIAGTSAGQGFGGDITIDANIIQIDGASEGQLFSSGILADALTEGIGGNINITANELTLENGGAISTSTFGTVQGGTVDINVPEVFLTGSSANSAIKTGIYAQSFDAGNAGRIEVATANLTLENSAKISVSSDPQAEDSGNLINRTNAWINVLAARDPDDDLTADFRVARGTGNGDAGNIDISAREQIVLNDRAEIVAETSSGDGGNINMSIGNLLLLRRGSNISTTAGTAQAGGNGGNITIDVADGFVVAPPYENNDITANAFEGNGGNVTITAQAIFGLEVRDELTPLSDITASSEFGLDGTVQLNTLGIDPNNGLTNLPEDQNDPEVRQGCSRGGVNSSSLTVQGIGGAPDNPDDMLIPEFDDEFISFDELETDGTIAESDEGIEAIAPNGNQTPILFSCQ